MIAERHEQRRLGMRTWTLLLLCLVFVSVPGHAADDAAGLTVTGRVLDASGGPIAGATVDVAALESDHASALRILAGQLRPDAVNQATTDEDGWFVLRVPDAGSWRVRVDVAGYVPMQHPLTPLLESRVLSALRLTPAEAIAVKVEGPEGSPIKGAQVRGTPLDELRWSPWYDRSWSPAPRLALSDKRGRATLLRAHGEPIEVRAHGPGVVVSALRAGEPTDLYTHGPRFVASAPQTIEGSVAARPIVATLRRGARFKVIFDTASRQDWRGAVVFVDGGPAATFPDDPRLIPPAIRFHTTPDVPLVVDLIRADGYRVRVHAGPPDPPNAQRSTIDLDDGFPRIIEGTVLSAETGAPVADAWVWRRGHEGNAVRTDDRGAFRLIPNAVGTVELRSAARGFGVGRASLTVNRYLGMTDAKIHLQSRATIEGRVTDVDGRAIGGADVRAIFELRFRDDRWKDALWSSRASLTLPDGSFRMTGLDSRVPWRLRVEKAGYASTMRAGDPDTAIEITLPRPRRVVGRIEDEANQPIVGVVVTMVAEADLPVNRYVRRIEEDQPPVTRGRTDVEGRFVLEGLAPGDHLTALVHAGHADRRGERVHVDIDRTETDLGILRLAEEALIEGRVVDAEGRPIAGTTVGWLTEGAFVGGMTPDRVLAQVGARRRTETNVEGRFRIGGLPAGDAMRLMIRVEDRPVVEKRQVVAPTETPIEIVVDGI